MTHYKGRVLELRLEIHQNPSALIEAPAKALPAPGQYIQAHHPADLDTVLPVSLFPGGLSAVNPTGDSVSIEVASPVPETWLPGTPIELRGPLGHGFELPAAARRVVLAAFNAAPARLLPLIPAARAQDAEIALFSDTLGLDLPAAIEVNPLASLPDGLAWADFAAVDLPLEGLPKLPNKLGHSQDAFPPCPVQLLIFSPMPCGALADCGLCALPAKRGWKMACKHGPVFNLQSIAF